MKTLKKIIVCVMLSLTMTLTLPAITPQMLVVAEAATIKLSDTKLNLIPDEYYQLSVKNAGKQKVKWKSSDKKIVTVTSKGKVHAVGLSNKNIIITATEGKKTLKCKVKIIETEYVDAIWIYNSNWTYTGYDYYGKKVTNVVPGYMEIVKYKNCYYWYTETEGGSQGTEHVAYNYSLHKIGKKLPDYIANPSYAYQNENGEYVIADDEKDIPESASVLRAVDILVDKNLNFITERARNYTEKEWKERMKELGFL